MTIHSSSTCFINNIIQYICKKELGLKSSYEMVYISKELANFINIDEETSTVDEIIFIFMEYIKKNKLMIAGGIYLDVSLRKIFDAYDNCYMDWTDLVRFIKKHISINPKPFYLYSIELPQEISYEMRVLLESENVITRKEIILKMNQYMVDKKLKFMDVSLQTFVRINTGLSYLTELPRNTIITYQEFIYHIDKHIF